MTRKVLVVRGPTYYAPGDETAFFVWLKSIGCVGEISGHLYDLHIHLKRKPSIAQFRELDALFRRYRMNRRRLVKWKPEGFVT